jgi:hypothetical protein
MSLFNVVSNQKFAMILKNLDDWDEWFLIIETMIKRDKIEKFVNLIIIESSKLIKSSSFTFIDFVKDVTSLIDLSIAKRHDLIILRKNHKKLLRTYKERIDALKILDLFILISIDRMNLLYLKNKMTIFQKLLAFKKRLASIDRIRKLEIIRRYKNLLRVCKHQQLNHWLLNWKKMYAKTIRLNISDVQDHRCLYDFLNALKTIDVIFVIDRKTILNYEVQQKKTSLFIFDFLKKFRNHLRIVKTLFNQTKHTNKKANHSAFAIFQDQDTKLADQKFNHKCSNDCEHSESESDKSNLIVIKSNDKKYSNCLCEMSHRYMKCSYIRSRIRQRDWKFDLSILKMIKTKIKQIIDEMKITLDRILKRDADATNKKKETKKSNKSNNVSIENSFYSSFAMFSAFAIDSILYKLLNCWILDCATNIHVCNDSSRFQIKRLINFEDRLRIDKTIYSIEKYEIVHIVVKKSHDSINIQLLNVVLASNFLINLICLNKFIVKNVYWDTERRHLYTNDITFCYTESIKRHWILKNNLSFSNQSNEFATFATKSAMFKSNRVAINAEWHIMLNHVNSETVAHLEKSIDDVKIIDDSSVLTTIACETCVLIKTYYVISRRFKQFESTNYSLDKINFNLIFMHRAYNDD